MERPSVTIELVPYLQDYLLAEFGGKPTDTGVQIHSKSDIGKFILSKICVCERPPKQELKDYPFTIYLPVCEWNHHVFRENFLWIPEYNQVLIRYHLEASFRLKQREFFVAGYEKGYKQDIIVQAFLTQYNIRNNALSYDAVKKYDYRNRKKTAKEVAKQIQLELFN